MTIAASIAGHHCSTVAAKRCTSGEVEVEGCTDGYHNRAGTGGRRGVVQNSDKRWRRFSLTAVSYTHLDVYKRQEARRY